jgi:hypothetical protein
LEPDCIGPIWDGFFVQLDQLSAILACAILAGLTVFQGALIGGAPLGRMAWGGHHEVLSARLRIGSAVSIALYAALAKAGLAPPFVSETFTSISMWVLTGYFSLGIVLNLISRSKPERLIMTPTVLVLATLYLVLALN